MNKYIFHITDSRLLRSGFDQDYYSPENYPLVPFVHCSTRKQVIRVANRFYSGKSNLYLIKINTILLKAPVVYENLEGGLELFPHIYGILNLDAIEAVAQLTEIVNQGFVFPSFHKQGSIIRSVRMVK